MYRLLLRLLHWVSLLSFFSNPTPKRAARRVARSVAYKTIKTGLRKWKL